MGIGRADFTRGFGSTGFCRRRCSLAADGEHLGPGDQDESQGALMEQ